jgi:predicted PurR-regulated permease PerM
LRPKTIGGREADGQKSNFLSVDWSFLLRAVTDVSELSLRPRHEKGANLFGSRENTRNFIPMSPRSSQSSLRPILVFALWILVIIACFWLFSVGRSILVPLVLSFLGVYLVETVTVFCRKVPVIGPRIPEWLARILAHVIIILLAIKVIIVIADNAAVIVEKAPEYQERLMNVYQSTLDTFGVADLEFLDSFQENLKLGTVLGAIGSGLTGLLGNTLIILLFFFFLSAERQFIGIKLDKFFGDENKRESFTRIWAHIDRDIRIYLGVKTFVSMLVGVGGYVVLLLVGVDFAEFWGLILFLFNFIPNIGSFIATALPTILALVQFDSLRPALTVVIAITILQVVIGNLLEPQLMGRSLNLSPFVVIFSLVFWGALWGIVGMLLCVPFTVIIMIILANFESTRRFAVLLSKDGEIRGHD